MGYNNLSELFAATADAIRAKTGSADPIVANDFPVYIAAIETGGVGVSQKEFLERTFTEISDASVLAVAPKVFYDNTVLTSANFPCATSIGERCFSGCTMLQTVDIRAAETIGSWAFYYCTRLATLDLPAVKAINDRAFYYCMYTEAVILRRTDVVCTLGSANVFQGSAVANGSGYVYVPRSLLEQYKTAEYWSAHAAQLRALEDYTVDGTTTGALDETRI